MAQKRRYVSAILRHLAYFGPKSTQVKLERVIVQRGYMLRHGNSRLTVSELSVRYN
jgi:hypothetical protein